ncbi:hypothetical protein Y032_1459g3883 [Ancylostoma ceylanicum]|uniref:Uncharacterized protein n=1 Tax=Ancylostoma ceylanicum TaxID=53326 RepID=A0A016W6Y9_9BILA|nr:hypothetical protein Y032_1459g3883 [Ancylostoma ceylanicum]
MLGTYCIFGAEYRRCSDVLVLLIFFSFFFSFESNVGSDFNFKSVAFLNSIASISLLYILYETCKQCCWSLNIDTVSYNICMYYTFGIQKFYSNVNKIIPLDPVSFVVCLERISVHHTRLFKSMLWNVFWT